jgi:hypothetical protein
VKLLSSDHKVFEVEAPLHQEYVLVTTYLKDGKMKDAIHMRKVNSRTLARVLECCQYYAKAQNITDESPAIVEGSDQMGRCIYQKISCNASGGLPGQFENS